MLSSTLCILHKLVLRQLLVLKAVVDFSCTAGLRYSWLMSVSVCVVKLFQIAKSSYNFCLILVKFGTCGLCANVQKTVNRFSKNFDFIIFGSFFKNFTFGLTVTQQQWSNQGWEASVVEEYCFGTYIHEKEASTNYIADFGLWLAVSYQFSENASNHQMPYP